jgi:hypothetical protein
MSLNKYKPHIYVLPEDDANRQIAIGFLLDPNLDGRAIQILPPLGGWTQVVDTFTNVHAVEMQRYEYRRIVLLIDFDGQYERRFREVRSKIPQELVERVYVLGALSDPEALKNSIKRSFEEIGKDLSQDCVDNTRKVWGHDLLRHNEAELERMISSVKPFLFGTWSPNSFNS